MNVMCFMWQFTLTVFVLVFGKMLINWFDKKATKILTTFYSVLWSIIYNLWIIVICPKMRYKSEPYAANWNIL